MSAMMTPTAALLASLDTITYETTSMLRVAEDVQPQDRRELKRRIMVIRAQAQELFDWLAESRFEEPRN